MIQHLNLAAGHFVDVSCSNTKAKNVSNSLKTMTENKETVACLLPCLATPNLAKRFALFRIT